MCFLGLDDRTSSHFRLNTTLNPPGVTPSVEITIGVATIIVRNATSAVPKATVAILRP